MSEVHTSRSQPAVVHLEIDCQPVNAISTSAQQRLTEELVKIDQDITVRSVVLSGRGRHFCAGADLRQEQEMERDAVGGFLSTFGELLSTIRNLRVPVVAAIDGAAAGGGLELAMACDLRVVGERAKFIAAGVNVGLVANFRLLATAIGDARARSMLLTGLPVDSATAMAWGLATEAVPSVELIAQASAIAERIATRAPLSVEATKRCLNQSLDLDEAEAFALQGRTFARLFRTEDHAEALVAHFEKREGKYFRK